jgi:hypothetical protein
MFKLIITLAVFSFVVGCSEETISTAPYVTHYTEGYYVEIDSAECR